jgi:hypothetical protein
MKRDEVEPQAGFIQAVTHAFQFQAPHLVAEERRGSRGGGLLSSPTMKHIVMTAAAIFWTEY